MLLTVPHCNQRLQVICLKMQVIADTYGNVKGTMSNPSADPPLREDGKLNVGAAVGRGVLAVVRSHPKNEQPYQGMIPIATGEVAEDLARYLADSEQTNSALALGVSINRDTSIRSAGGFLIQVRTPRMVILVPVQGQAMHPKSLL